jgi:hypothetical protein
MSATFFRRLVGAAVVFSVLAGCAYRPDSTVVDSERGPVIVEDAPRKSRILQFCEDYEMVCILGGIAVFGGAIAIIKGSSGDAN